MSLAWLYIPRYLDDVLPLAADDDAGGDRRYRIVGSPMLVPVSCNADRQAQANALQGTARRVESSRERPFEPWLNVCVVIPRSSVSKLPGGPEASRTVSCTTHTRMVVRVSHDFLEDTRMGLLQSCLGTVDVDGWMDICNV
jgi:hypothetical protein